MSHPQSTLRHDCQAQGCWHEKHAIKYGAFNDCLPGKIAFTDLDGIVEINGSVLVVEWKSTTVLPIGQQLLIERLALNNYITTCHVVGDAQEMSVSLYRFCCPDKKLGLRWSEWVEADIGDLRKAIRRWANKANSRRYHYPLVEVVESVD